MDESLSCGLSDKAVRVNRELKAIRHMLFRFIEVVHRRRER